MPRPDPAPTPPLSPRRRAVLLATAAAAFLLSGVLFRTIGAPDAAASLAAAFPPATFLAWLWMLAAFGLGLALLPRAPRTLAAALGVAILLTLAHLLGVLGAWGTPAARPIAWLPLVLGLAALIRPAARLLAGLRAPTPPTDAVPEPRVPFVITLAATALTAALVSLLLTAAESPPGWLWDSEARGYDTLSYHLQLPQEWLAAGRLWPVTHNVYSFLPSSVEAAFLHLAVLAGAPGPTDAARAWGFTTGSGDLLAAAQTLHALLTLLAALAIAELTLTLARRAALPHHAPAVLAVTAALVLSIPWTVVVGSSAYNEMPVLALTAAALLVALDPARSPATRAALAAFLIGAACGCKPTALLLSAPPVALALALTTPRRAWPAAALLGALVGLATLAPWLIRNHLATGNALFPFAHTLLGPGHWTAEQLARFSAAHAELSPLAQRLRLLVLPDPADPAGLRHRGLMHPQWFLFFPTALLAVLAAVLAAALAPRTPARRLTLLLVLGLALQLAAWFFLTHLQSRFLLPLVVLAAPLIVLATLLHAHRLPPARALIAPLAVALLLADRSITLFAQQPGRDRPQPNLLRTLGAGARTGELFRAEFAAASPTQRDRLLDTLDPVAFCNLTLPPAGTLYLLGDATPLYLTRPVLYHTTWDGSPLAAAIRADPDAPGKWADALRARGVRWILVSAAELTRLSRSGWLDPALTPERVQAFLNAHTAPVHQWQTLGVTLVELIPAPPATPPRQDARATPPAPTPQAPPPSAAPPPPSPSSASAPADRR